MLYKKTQKQENEFERGKHVLHLSINQKKICYLLVATLILFSSCSIFSPTISSYDSYSYIQTTSIKVDAINLMDMATEDYQLHQKEIASVQSNIQKIFEYEKHRPKNEITVKQWGILADSSGVLGRFIIKWRTEKTLGKVYIDDKKKNVAFVFDQIAELESKKIKSSDIKN